MEPSSDEAGEPPVAGGVLVQAADLGGGNGGRGRGAGRGNGTGGRGGGRGRGGALQCNAAKFVPLSLSAFEISHRNTDCDGAESHITFESSREGDARPNITTKRKRQFTHSSDEDEDEEDNEEEDDEKEDDEEDGEEDNEEDDEGGAVVKKEAASPLPRAKRHNSVEGRSMSHQQQVAADALRNVLGMNLGGAAGGAGRYADSSDDDDDDDSSADDGNLGTKPEKADDAEGEGRGGSERPGETRAKVDEELAHHQMREADRRLFRVKGITCVACALGKRFAPIMDWIDEHATSMSPENVYRMATFRYKELILDPNERERNIIALAAKTFGWKDLRTHVMFHSVQSRMHTVDSLRQIQTFKKILEDYGTKRRVEPSEDDAADGAGPTYDLDKSNTALWHKLFEVEAKTRKELLASEPATSFGSMSALGRKGRPTAAAAPISGSSTETAKK